MSESDKNIYKNNGHLLQNNKMWGEKKGQKLRIRN